ncbi:hypothetical protein [Engelhardtia mirabilis]|uniref:Response regulator receiver domain protein n=1 Tax=Engelhardtia mirabilis TaxID=2528011 RepID=A0A518BEV7_9BACT|nr:Response regulator receiver domain protein [Planctomycetes bacterium Pla133]QDU99840.1 Response regulator receiver domain protein [Planctomycetes bacterium Pla86]
MSNSNENRRILVVDDNQAIHDDFTKILMPCREAAAASAELDDLAASILGDQESASIAPRLQPTYELSHALQGKDALAQVQAAGDEGKPFAMVFMDVRMPPGWDGVDTLKRLWEVDPELQGVVCTAYADYSYDEIVDRLGSSDRFLILKKPFDSIEVQQLASTLTNKWQLRRDIRDHLDQIEAYAKSLETVNLALDADKRVAESFAQSQSEFVLGAGRAFGVPADALMRTLESLTKDGGGFDEAFILARNISQGLHHLADLAALETGHRRARLEDCDLSGLLLGIAEGARAHCLERQIPLRLTQASPIPIHAKLDGDLLTRALQCILSWSIERADARGVAATLSMTSPSFGAPELCIEVELHGSPLNEEQRELLFMPFRNDEVHPDRVLALPLAQLAAKELSASLELDGRLDGTTRVVLRVDPGPGSGELRGDLWPSKAAA